MMSEPTISFDKLEIIQDGVIYLDNEDIEPLVSHLFKDNYLLLQFHRLGETEVTESLFLQFDKPADEFVSQYNLFMKYIY